MVRLLGLPVIVMAAPGDPRTTARTAWPTAPRPASSRRGPPRSWPRPTCGTGPARRRYTGAISRFDGRPTPARLTGRREVLVVVGAGGSALRPDDVDAARRATPGWTWRTLGVDGWAGGDDIWAALHRSDVVVCHGGQNVLAEVAAARRPAVVLPQSRPFDEQHATASALADAGIAVAPAGPPAADAWPELLDRACALGGDGWARWSHGDGAARAAAVLAAVADDAERPGEGRRMTRSAVITPVAGRAAHLRAQRAALAAGDTVPDLHVIVAMGPAGELVDTDRAPRRAPARDRRRRDRRARRGTAARGRPQPRRARRATPRRRAAGVPRRRLPAGTASSSPATGDAARGPPRRAARRPRHLPAADPARRVVGGRTWPTRRRPHPARPDPAPGDVVDGEHRLFWSLSFAVTALDVGPHRRLRRGLRRLRRGGHRPRAAGPGRRGRPALGRRGRRVPPAPPHQPSAPGPGRRRAPQRRAASPRCGAGGRWRGG